LAARRRGRSRRGAQQPAMPIVGFVDGRSAEASVRQAAAFRKGLNETGYVEGQNLMVEYHWLEGQYNRLPALMADLVRRRVAVIAALSNPTALAAKAATTTIPIVFGVGQDPVRMGLVASLARPGGNATGTNTGSAMPRPGIGPKDGVARARTRLTVPAARPISLK